MSKSPSPEPSRPKRSVDQYLRYSNIAFQLFAAIFIGVWGGMKLDAWLHTDPWFKVILSLLGVSAGLYSVLKEFIQPGKK
ncbi:MAG TPA: AtpZ/AtpI family protein [Chitinophagales bacterium]|nr:AtpZ/AtpI family protein [Chitinophagales bacterium]